MDFHFSLQLTGDSAIKLTAGQGSSSSSSKITLSAASEALFTCFVASVPFIYCSTTLLYVLFYSMTKVTTHYFNFKYRSQMTESNWSLQNFTKYIYSSIGLKFIFGVLVLQLIISIFCYFKSTLYYILEPHILLFTAFHLFNNLSYWLGQRKWHAAY